MDRDNRWDRIELAYNTMVFGDSNVETADVTAAIANAYEAGISDEFILPTVIQGYSGINKMMVFLFKLSRRPCQTNFECNW